MSQSSLPARHTRCLLARCLRWCVALLVTMVPGVAGTNAIAQPPDRAGPALAIPRTPSPDRASEPSQDHWVPKLMRMLTPDPSDSDSAATSDRLAAFAEVAGRTSKSVATVLVKRQPCALGMVVDSDGLVVTKASELGQRPAESELHCRLADRSQWKARLITVDRAADLALLKIATSGVPAVRWSDASVPSVGSWIISVGPGSVGSADGLLAVGVVSVAPHTVRGGMLGVKLLDGPGGPEVVEIVAGSSAEKATVQLRDIVTHANGKPVSNSDALVELTSRMLPRDELDLTIRRGDQVLSLKAVLLSPADTLSSKRARFQDSLGTQLSQRRVLFPTVFEHDSVLTPDQCGGPVVDVRGEVIGINIARATRISCFALPGSVVRAFVERHRPERTSPVFRQSAHPSKSLARSAADAR